MADGTRVKQMELQLQQVTTTVVEMKNRVGSIEEMIGLAIDKKLEVVAERLREDMHNHIREEMREQGNMLHDQLQQFVLMFSSQN